MPPLRIAEPPLRPIDYGSNTGRKRKRDPVLVGLCVVGLLIAFLVVAYFVVDSLFGMRPVFFAD